VETIYLFILTNQASNQVHEKLKNKTNSKQAYR